MGIISSKSKKCHLSNQKNGTTEEFYTPVKSYKENMEEDDYSVDPRSPTINIFRTPLGPSPSKTGAITKHQNLTKIDEVFKTPLQNDRLVKTMQQKLLDPRSPSTYIDRTPMIFKDEPILKNDTIPSVEFNEITNDSIDFLESMDDMKIDPRSPSIDVLRTPLVFNDTIEEDEFKDIEEDIAEVDLELFKEVIVEPTETKLNLDEKDPRSPSIDIERTPLVLVKDEDDEISEDIKYDSLKALETFEETESNETLKTNVEEPVIVKPIKAKETTNDAKSLLNNIYQDEYVKYGTPNKKLNPIVSTDEKQRTPLSCLANKTGPKLGAFKQKNNARNIKERMIYDENKCITPTIYTDNNEDIKVIKSAKLSANGKSRIPVLRQK